MFLIENLVCSRAFLVTFYTIFNLSFFLSVYHHLPSYLVDTELNFSYSSQVQLKTLKITTYTYTDKKTLKSRKKKNIEWLETLKHKEKHDFWVPYIFFLLHLSQNRYWRSQKPINVNEHRPKKVKTKVYSLKSKNLKRRF